MTSYLNSWVMDGGTTTADAGIKAKELGLIERINDLLGEGPVSSLIPKAAAADCSTCDGAPDCSTALQHKQSYAKEDMLVELDKRLNTVWGAGK